MVNIYEQTCNTPNDTQENVTGTPFFNVLDTSGTCIEHVMISY